MRGWVLVGLQTLAILAGAFTFSASMEHRFTVLEETLKAQQNEHRALIEQLAETQREVEKIVALEEVIHHQAFRLLNNNSLGR